MRIVSEAPNPQPPDDNSGRREAIFSQGVFKLFQDNNHPFTTEARLTGGTSCGSGKAKAPAKRRVLDVLAKRGRHRSRGRRGAGTVRGTHWLTEDKCKGTKFSVFEGRVRVEDFARNRKVTLDAGESYFARKRK